VRVTAPQPNPIEGARILVVEDEYLIGVELQRTLETVGAAEVVVVARPADALSAIAQTAFDLAVLDVRLGEGTSEPVAAALAGLRIPFIYATGWGDPPGSAPGIGEVPLLHKPFSSDALIEALALAARGRRK
jgi:DNA-binding NtrC family response regulator